MHPIRSRLVSILVVLVTGLALVPASGPTRAAPAIQDPASAALQLAAQRYNLPIDQLEVVNSAEGSYPALGVTVRQYKVMDRRDGAIYLVSLDRAGQAADSAALLAQESAAIRRVSGKLEPALAAQLALTDAGSPIKVILWLKEDSPARPARPSPDLVLSRQESQAYRRMADTERAGFVSRITAPVVNRLAGLGRASAADAFAPVVYATLTPEEIRAAAQWAEVDTVYLDVVNYPELESVFGTVRADVVYSRRINGRGVKVGFLEVGGRAEVENPYLKAFIQDTTFACETPSPHTTGVLGILYSSNPTRTGIATGAEVWVGGSCNGDSDQLQDRAISAADWGAQALNLSWGSNIGLTPGANDRYFDSLWVSKSLFVVKSGGNEAGTCGTGTGNITSPGLGYNIMAVGNFDDRNTTSWEDDIMNSCSSWRDPLSTFNDREKPEVAAPGTNINSTTTSEPWTGSVGTGSSFSAPVVTGIAAQLMQRQSGLEFWPEVVKAILLASAVNNIEGSATLSEADGAGGVSAMIADDIANNISGGSGTFNGKDYQYTCTQPKTLDITTMPLQAGQMARVALVWDQDTNYANYTTQPGADLDLEIISPSGARVAGSFLNDNTYEIVQFTPPSAGNYKLRIVKVRCDYAPPFLGWAWWQVPVEKGPNHMFLPAVFSKFK